MKDGVCFAKKKKFNDLLKFFLQIMWEHKIIDHKQYGSLILLLDEIGRMLGGWKKDIQEKL